MPYVNINKQIGRSCGRYEEIRKYLLEGKIDKSRESLGRIFLTWNNVLKKRNSFSDEIVARGIIIHSSLKSILEESDGRHAELQVPTLDRYLSEVEIMLNRDQDFKEGKKEVLEQ